MAIADYSTLLNRINNRSAVFLPSGYAGGENGIGTWGGGRNAFTNTDSSTGDTITTSNTFTVSSAGSFLARFPISGTTDINICNVSAPNTEDPTLFFLVDRLSGSGNFGVNTTSAQTTNLPTPALPRYTTGEGVYAFVEPNTSLGTTAVEIAISYTNQSGTSGRTSPSVPIAGTGFTSSNFPIPLADGDTGVRSVESVTITGTSTNANKFAICLYKILSCFAVVPGNAINPVNIVTGGFLGPATVPEDSCLMAIAVSSIGATSLSCHSFGIVMTQE